jgi:hypothetical protein
MAGSAPAVGHTCNSCRADRREAVSKAESRAPRRPLARPARWLLHHLGGPRRHAEGAGSGRRRPHPHTTANRDGASHPSSRSPARFSSPRQHGSTGGPKLDVRPLLHFGSPGIAYGPQRGAPRCVRAGTGLTPRRMPDPSSPSCPPLRVPLGCTVAAQGTRLGRACRARRDPERNRICLDAVVSVEAHETTAADDTRSSALPSTSRLLSAGRASVPAPRLREVPGHAGRVIPSQPSGGCRRRC